jgi:hypothetical protein
MLLPIASQIAVDAMKRQMRASEAASPPGLGVTASARASRRRVRRGLAHVLRATARRLEASGA